MKIRNAGLLIVLLFGLSLFNTFAFAVPDDSILSQHIKEADGTSGQNTNSGSGVKTEHIQDGAVTSSKIADGSVTDAKITGTISGTKLGSHTHSGADITNGTITNSKIADGAVTDAKITGPISTSKIQKYGKVAVVAQSGGDYADPVAAMNNIAAWCGTSSATNPCLIKIMPGIYTLGSTLMMASYVDMEGSGADTTKIVGTVRYEYTTNNELRTLTVESPIENSTAVHMEGSHSLQIRDVLLIASAYGGHGINAWYSGDLVLKHVDISASEAGIYTYYPYGDVSIDDSTISAAVGFQDGSDGGSGNLYIKNSKISSGGAAIITGFLNLFVTGSDLVDGVGDAIYCYQTRNVTIRDSVVKAPRYLILGSCVSGIAHTMLDGTPPTGAVCFGVYDVNYNQVVCP